MKGEEIKLRLTHEVIETREWEKLHPLQEGKLSEYDRTHYNPAEWSSIIGVPSFLLLIISLTLWERIDKK